MQARVPERWIKNTTSFLLLYGKIFSSPKQKGISGPFCLQSKVQFPQSLVQRGLLPSQLQNRGIKRYRGLNKAALSAHLKVISKGLFFFNFCFAETVALPSQRSRVFMCPTSMAGRTKGAVVNPVPASPCSQASHLHFFHKFQSNLYSKRQLLSWLLALETTFSNKMQ